jgi:hypothetical protein
LIPFCWPTIMNDCPSIWPKPPIMALSSLKFLSPKKF